MTKALEFLEATNMLKAKLECLKRETSGTDFDCNNRNCDECSLCYEQGNMGEQKEALDMAIKALEQMNSSENQGNWIPVSKRMPEPRIDVWCNSDMGQMVGYYDEYAETWYGRDYLELIVTAWMPLPEPYDAESED